jgi:hypothetical protein
MEIWPPDQGIEFQGIEFRSWALRRFVSQIADQPPLRSKEN